MRLEPLSLLHVADLFAALNEDPAIWRWWRVAPPESIGAMEQYLRGMLQEQAEGKIVAFTQIECGTRRAVGGTTYLDIRRKDRGLEIGSTWLGKPWQRTALNTEAKYLLLHHAFETLDAARVQLKTDARNIQSQMAIERLGAVREGVLRKHMLVRDGFLRDTVMYSILDEEWPAVKAHLQARLS